MSRVPLRRLLSAEEANRFGFDWPPVKYVGTFGAKPEVRAIPDPEGGAHVQVTRTSTIRRGKKGTWKVLTVRTDKDELDIYIAPKGRMRVFRKGRGELVQRVKSR